MLLLLLIANYRGMMALSVESPYCILYPIIYNDEVVDKTHFNTKDSPSGMCTKVGMCRFFLHLADKDPANRRRFEGSHLMVLCGTQYDHFFPEITTLHNHQGPLGSPNTGQPYPVVSVGDFCLMDSFFPCCPGDSFVFHESELTKLWKKGYSVSIYHEETPKSTSTKGGTHKSPHTKENMQEPSHKAEEPHQSSSKALGTSSPWSPGSMSTSKFSHKMKHLPQVKEHKDKHDHKDCNNHSKTKDWPYSNKGKKCSSDKDGSSATSQEKCKCGHSPDVNGSSLECKQKSSVLTAPPAPQVGAHGSGTRAPPGV